MNGIDKNWTREQYLANFENEKLFKREHFLNKIMDVVVSLSWFSALMLANNFGFYPFYNRQHNPPEIVITLGLGIMQSGYTIFISLALFFTCFHPFDKKKIPMKVNFITLAVLTVFVTMFWNFKDFRIVESDVLFLYRLTVTIVVIVTILFNWSSYFIIKRMKMMPFEKEKDPKLQVFYMFCILFPFAFMFYCGLTN